MRGGFDVRPGGSNNVQVRGAVRQGIVVGLAAEARIAAVLGDVATGGGLPAGAEAAAERLVARGAEALISFGLAGGLKPGLRAGEIVVPAAVLEAGTRHLTDPAISRRLGGLTAELMVAGHLVVADAAIKRRLFESTGAVAVDLESGAVARVAARHRLPFAVLRAICDPADRTLPPAALVALSGDGAIRGLRVLTSLLLHPWQMRSLILLGRDAAIARRALIAAAGFAV
jgi:adenosylhomocysteine nucleosidase